MPLPTVTTFLLIHLVLLQLMSSGGLANPPEASSESTTEEFTHLIKRAKINKRVHIISELVRNGHRLQVEEYLDLERWYQLIQFKWHDYERTGDKEELVTQKINIVIMNENNRKVIVQYEPYLCKIQDLNVTSENLDSDWKLLLMSSTSLGQQDLALNNRKRHLATIRSILSTAKNSPYLARIVAGLWQAPVEAWVFGVSGLWIKAQYPGQGNNLPYQMSHQEQGVRVEDADSWRLDLKDSNTILMYYFDELELNDNSQTMNQLANSERTSPHLIELRGLEELDTIDTINIIDVDFNFSNELRKELFNLPIGFNCQSNPLFHEENLRFESYEYKSFLLELEFVGTKFKELKDPALYSATDIKTVSIARSVHFLNPGASLAMYHILENKFKTIRDFQSRTRYNMHQIKMSETCKINRLHSLGSSSQQSYDPVDVVFNNGVSISITEYFLDYLLHPKIIEENGNEMKLLNRITISQQESELVFESQVPEWLDYIVRVTDKKGKSIARKISLIRVYRAKQNRSPLAMSARFTRQGPLKLDRIILLIFNYKHEEILAEVRINFLKRLEPLSFSRRAKLFDVSQCFSRDESMQLVATYPVDSNLLSVAQDKSHDLIEAFYGSPLLYFTNNGNSSLLNPEKRRLAKSLNYFRVPKVELLRTEDGNIELHFTVLDKLSPLYLFDQLEESTFDFEPLASGERLMVGQVEECAKMCQMFRCRMFAYDKESYECKLSPNSIDDSEDDEKTPNFMDHSRLILAAIRRVTSTIYYLSKESKMLNKQADIEEASLVELLSYLEHYGSDLDLDLDDGDEGERVKREASLDSWPLFTFHYISRAHSKTTYGPSQRISLVPSQVRAVHVPLMLDVSGESQLIRALSAFKTKVMDKSYYLQALMETSSEGEIWQFGGGGGDSDMMKEKTFIDKQNQIYYTLKRLNMVEMDTCALMCFNIEEWDAAGRGEQTCISFSYCGIEKDCILLVKTDFSFTTSVLDLVEQGDQVLEVGSIEMLSRISKGCLISMRNYLSGFEGPIRMPSDVYGWESSKDLNTELQFEWSPELRVEWDEYDEQAADKCANKCYDYNKKGPSTCLAMDTCTKRMIVSDSKNRYEQTCHLFLIKNDELAERSPQVISSLARLRNQLGSTDQRQKKPTKGFTSKEVQMCNRYLIAHQFEFNHLKQRQVSQELNSILKSPSPPLDNINMDDCAFECSMRAKNCLVFEYCSRFEEETRSVSRRCSLFGAPRGVVSRVELTQESPKILSAYNRDCHLYLRKEYHSLEELLASKDIVRPSENVLERTKTRLMLITLYLVLALVFLFYMGVLKTENLLRRST